MRSDPGGDVLEQVRSLDPSVSDAHLAVALVEAAGTLAASMREGRLAVDTKGHISDVVTAADRGAEELVTATLRRCRPDDGILGEEGASHASRSGRSWVIDPVDGTYNFVAGLAWWCSALALRDDATGAPVLGAVHQPREARTWVAGDGVPLACNGTRQDGIPDAVLGEVSLASYLHPPTAHDPDRLEPWLALIRGAATLRVLGSGSVDLAHVATGVLGAFAQPDCPAWDWLPGAALVRAGGGVALEVEHRGHRWCLAGAPRVVDELVSRLLAS